MQVKDRRTLARLVAIQSVTQREIAEAVGWKSHSYVGRILRGKVTNVEPAAAAAIAELLDVDVADLFVPLPRERRRTRNGDTAA